MKNSPYINNERLPFPFCPGCSHGNVLEKIAEAMEDHGLDPLKTVIVTDIGCTGLSDQWFTTHTFHGLHGRSILYGEGLKLASPELTVIVFMGDGGAGIGAHHLIAAARRNIGITVIVFNNFNFGMTGGQHSATTPGGSVTTTTLQGHEEIPFKIAETMNINGAAYSARRAFYDKDLVKSLNSALSTNGFSLLEVLEFCTPYYSKFNRFKKSEMEEIMNTGVFPRVTLFNEREREYSTSIRNRKGPVSADTGENVYRITRPVPGPERESMSFIFAGSAGQKVQFAASLIASAAVSSGLHAYQQDDYPVTVRTGYSVSTIKLSSGRIDYPGTGKPGALMILTEDGLKRTGEYLSGEFSAKRVIAEKQLVPLLQGIKCEVFNLKGFDENVGSGLKVLAVLYHFFIREKVIERSVLEETLLGSGRVDEEDLECMRKLDPFV